MFRDSVDKNAREAKVKLRLCRKWLIAKRVEEAESRLRHTDVVGTVIANGTNSTGLVWCHQCNMHRHREQKKAISSRVRLDQWWFQP